MELVLLAPLGAGGRLAPHRPYRHSYPMTPDSIRVIVTGGTFDKAYDEIKGVLTFKESHLPEILALTRVTVPVNIELNQLIDSLEMQDENRRSVLAACERAAESRIIITHGTDTMAETARLIGPAGLAKTIVLTGAMVPYRVQGSDALFNFGTAFAAAQLLPRGVYIVMNGRAFSWDRVRKDRSRGVFEEA
jgi:L-asparaginase